MSDSVMPEQGRHLIPAAKLEALMRDVFRGLGVGAEDARHAVAPLMEATLAGYDSHGVMRVPRYAAALRTGEIDPQGAFSVRHATPAVAYVDAGNALGPVTAARAVELACTKARQVGVGCVSTTHSNDIGRLGSYLREPAQTGLLTILVANDSGGLPTVTPHGGAARFFSTNPLAAGIPRGPTPHISEPHTAEPNTAEPNTAEPHISGSHIAEPILIDLSTSMTSVGRLRMDAQAGRTAPAGWLIDRHGEAVLDPARFFDDPENTLLLPLGGQLAGHKGFALQLLIEVLAGALGGAGVVTGVDPQREANAIFVLALDPEHFVGRARFQELVEAMVAGLQQTPPLPGSDRVRLPGERAAAERARRTAAGIPLSPMTQAELRQTLTDLDLDPTAYALETV